MSKVRLDILLMDKGLAPSRERARADIMSGCVFVNGQRCLKPGTPMPEDSALEVRGGLKYCSRGGLKLEKALKTFGVSPEGLVCIDCGASTGGFTDCLLQNGAKRVFAVDVGYGQLAWSLRSDPRVTVMERTNVRYLEPGSLDEPPVLAVIDVSFISLRLVLPAVRALLAPGGRVICLIKPQFEAGREKVGKKGVVRDPETHAEVLRNFLTDAAAAGFFAAGLTYSPITGPEGNIEYLGFLVTEDMSDFRPDPDALAAESHRELSQ